MVVRLVGLEEIRVDVELGVQVEAAQVKHVGNRHLAEMHGFLRRARVHVRQAVHQRLDFLLGHQVGLADENLVGETDLAARLLAVVELLRRMLGVHQRQDGVEQILLGDFLVHEKSLRHRAGVGQAGGFNDHAVELQQALAFFGGQQLQRLAQVFANRAADAAVVHLDDVFLRVVDQDFVVDVFLAKLVLDDGDLLAVGLGQDAFQERGFARTEKAGEDGDRNQVHGVYLKNRNDKTDATTGPAPRNQAGGV